MHFILHFNIIAILGKRRLVRVDNPFHPFFSSSRLHSSMNFGSKN